MFAKSRRWAVTQRNTELLHSITETHTEAMIAGKDWKYKHRLILMCARKPNADAKVTLYPGLSIHGDGRHRAVRSGVEVMTSTTKFSSSSLQPVAGTMILLQRDE